MKKSQQTTDNGQQTTTIHASYEAARGVMMRLGVGEIWHTSDGQWFTAADKAEEHAKKMASTGSATKNIQDFKLKKF